MTATFFLSADHRALDLDFVRTLLPSRRSSARICYIGAAHDDDARWAQQSQAKLSKALGMPCDAPRLSDPDLDVATARRAILGAALLFLDGGDTVGLVAHAQARGLAPTFAQAARGDVLVAGVSAGACAVAAFTIGYDDAEQPQVAPCFAMGPSEPLDVHSEDDDWSEMRALLEHVADQQQLAQTGVVIPTGSALVIDARGQMTSRGKRRCERRALQADGRWWVSEIA